MDSEQGYLDFLSQSNQLWAEVYRKILLHLPHIASGLLVLLMFWIGSIVLRALIRRILLGRRIDAGLREFISKTAGTATLIFGMVTALGTMGIDVGALVAGLGLTGFALGFALKDIVSNILAGVMILLHKPFRRGALIKVSGFEGVVQEIDLRYTRLDSAEGDRIYIPNSMMFTNAIVVQRLQSAATSETKIL